MRRRCCWCCAPKECSTLTWLERLMADTTIWSKSGSCIPLLTFHESQQLSLCHWGLSATVTGDSARSRNHRGWTSSNAVLALRITRDAELLRLQRARREQWAPGAPWLSSKKDRGPNLDSSRCLVSEGRRLVPSTNRRQMRLRNCLWQTRCREGTSAMGRRSAKGACGSCRVVSAALKLASGTPPVHGSKAVQCEYGPGLDTSGSATPYLLCVEGGEEAHPKQNGCDHHCH